MAMRSDWAPLLAWAQSSIFQGTIRTGAVVAIRAAITASMRPTQRPTDPKFQYDCFGLGAGVGARVLSRQDAHRLYNLAGGWGLLLDLAGNDTYDSANFSQGIGYFFGIGSKLDLDGTDTHSAARYGHGGPPTPVWDCSSTGMAPIVIARPALSIMERQPGTRAWPFSLMPGKPRMCTTFHGRRDWVSPIREDGLRLLTKEAMTVMSSNRVWDWDSTRVLPSLWT